MSRENISEQEEETKMKKRILVILLLLSCFVCVKKTYAIQDVVAKVQSVLKMKDDVENKIQGIKGLGQMGDIKSLQGFVKEGARCFAAPANCAGGLGGALKIDNLLSGVSTPGSQSGDLSQKDVEDESKNILEKSTFQKGAGKDVQRRNEYKKESNIRVGDNIAKLFAKGVATRQSIIQEDSSIYKAEFPNNSLEEVALKQNTVSLNVQQRVARILELRSFMFYAPALKEMEQYNREVNEGN